MVSKLSDGIENASEVLISVSYQFLKHLGLIFFCLFAVEWFSRMDNDT